MHRDESTPPTCTAENIAAALLPHARPLQWQACTKPLFSPRCPPTRLRRGAEASQHRDGLRGEAHVAHHRDARLHHGAHLRMMRGRQVGQGGRVVVGDEMDEKHAHHVVQPARPGVQPACVQPGSRRTAGRLAVCVLRHTRDAPTWLGLRTLPRSSPRPCCPPSSFGWQTAPRALGRSPLQGRKQEGSNGRR